MVVRFFQQWLIFLSGSRSFLDFLGDDQLTSTVSTLSAYLHMQSHAHVELLFKLEGETVQHC